MAKFLNPLSVNTIEAPVSTSGASSSAVLSESAFNVDSSDYCPKCGSATVMTRLYNDEPVAFCTSCRVTLAMREEK